MSEPTVRDLGERALIERIRERAGHQSGVVLGIGDDAAVMEPPRNALEVFTTDAVVEGVHFDRDSSPHDVGHKALAICLSDVAAMGATPRASLLSLALPELTPASSFDALIDGFLSLAARHRVALLGGNITRSPGPLYVDVTAIGFVHRRRVLTRAGASAGDDLYVSGTVGAAAAGLKWLQSGADRGAPLDPCVAAYHRPEPRVRLGELVGRNRAATACMDLSDGLADAVAQVAGQSGLGAVVDAEAVPVHPHARMWFEQWGLDPVHAALTGGEDYELLFAVSPRLRRRFDAVCRTSGALPITRIGRVTRQMGLRLVRGGREEALPAGYVHFRDGPG